MRQILLCLTTRLPQPRGDVIKRTEVFNVQLPEQRKNDYFSVVAALEDGWNLLSAPKSLSDKGIYYGETVTVYEWWLEKKV